MKHNNAIQKIHLRKHWIRDGHVKTWFNQAARKRRRLEARREKADSLSPRPAESLRPVVRGQTQRYNRMVKLGRGFSLQEIKEAKLGVAFCRSIGVSVDHRRKNRCVEGLELNKNRLLAYVNKLALFPRKAGQPKKGLVNDSAAEVTEKAAQVAQMALPKQNKREKAVELTQAMKENKAYQVQKMAAMNHKWKGIREKRAKEEAEKKE